MFGILKYCVVLTLVVHGLKLATACNLPELKQMFSVRMAAAKKRDKPFHLLSMGICFLALGPALSIRFFLGELFEAICNCISAAKRAWKKIDGLTSAASEECKHGCEEAPAATE